MLSVQRNRGTDSYLMAAKFFSLDQPLFITFRILQVYFVLRIYPQEQIHSNDWQTVSPTQRVDRLAHHPSPFFQPYRW